MCENRALIGAECVNHGMSNLSFNATSIDGPDFMYLKLHLREELEEIFRLWAGDISLVLDPEVMNARKLVCLFICLIPR